MRIPDFKRHRGAMQAIAFFLCGMIVGAAVYNAMVIDQTNRIMMQNYEVKEQLDLAEKQLQANRQVSIIRSVVLFVKAPDNKPPLDAVTQVELKKKLEQDLSILKGRSIYDIGSDAALVSKLLKDKLYTGIGDKDMVVSIKTMLVADSVLQVWVEARPAAKQLP